MSLQTISDAIKTRAAKVSPIGNTLKFTIGKNQCLFLDGTGKSNIVSNENKNADCTVAVSMKDLEAIIKGSLNPMTAFFTGKIKVAGDMSVAMKLPSFLS